MLTIKKQFNLEALKKQVMAVLLDSHVDVQNFKQCLVTLGFLDNGDVLKAVYIDNIYKFNK